MKTTDIAIIKQEEKAVGALILGLFRDTDFNSLNSIIDKLGDKSAELGVEEKVAAVSIVDEWETNVISRMNNYSYKMRTMVNAFNVEVHHNTWLGADSVGELSMAQVEQMIVATETKALWDVAMGHYETMNEYRQDCSPERGYTDNNMSANEINRIHRKYDLERSRYDVEYTRLERKVKIAFREFMKAFLKHKLVKDLIAKAKSYNSGLQDALAECHMKSTMAKLNIQIASADIRGAIHELLAFSSTL